MADALDHIYAQGFTSSRNFKSTLMVVKPPPPARNRVPHGQKLLRDIGRLRAYEQELINRRSLIAMSEGAGMAVAIEFVPKGAYDFASLEWSRDGIEVLTTAATDHADIVIVHVPSGRLDAFEKRVRSYIEDNTPKGKPRNAALINAIESFRRAAFDELWTSDAQLPAEDTVRWFQLWLRAGVTPARQIHRRFSEAAERLNIEVESGYLPFPGRVVVAVRATRNALQAALDLLDMVAEIRPVEPTAEFFLSDLTVADQRDWAHNLLARMVIEDPAIAPYVTLLDTGVAHHHPLLASHVKSSDVHTTDPSWPAHDHHGHGTQMAGVILHGDLTEPLSSNASHHIPHYLESVNIYPPSGSNHPHLYGWVTETAVNIVEQQHPDRRRTFVMMSTSTGVCVGVPIEWSATIDRLAFGSDGALLANPAERRKRLFVLSCGNVPWTQWGDYPHINSLSGCEDPSQAWNALVVGAHTELVQIDVIKWPHLRAIAQHGHLSPCSTTSQLWGKAWPSRPDVVAEGGNGSRDSMGEVVGPESLRILTTCKDISTALLTETGDTSAAAGLVARLCAAISNRYPTYWPETIRALVVHGATYSTAMRSELPANSNADAKRALLAKFGFGAANADRSLNSGSRRPNVVIQESLKPYEKSRGSIGLSRVNMHQLPWPSAELAALGGARVALRVTLSYFVEPNPSQRGWQSKFRYQSHGLRFAVKAASESDQEFNQRINKIDRDEAVSAGLLVDSMPDPDSQAWLLGKNVRSRGSLHSDTWEGTAADLAAKSHIAIFPVGGWWKDWGSADRFNESVRYALIVSLEIAESVDIDLYAPIAAQIRIPISVPVLT